jgi:hypothetical protein
MCPGTMLRGGAAGFRCARQPADERDYVTQDHYCGKCGKKQRMTRCEVCKGTGGGQTTQCNSGCNRHGWLCPVHGKNY